MNESETYRVIRDIAREELKALNLDIKPWHQGKINEVVSPTKLKVFVDGSDTAQTIPCSKNEPYAVGDEVWIVYINNNPRDKFVFGLRGLST